MRNILSKNWVRPILFLPVFLILTIIFQLIAYIALDMDLSVDDIDTIVFTSTQNLFIFLAGLLGVLIPVWFFMRFVDKEPFKNIGLQLTNRSKDIFAGFLAGVVMISTGFVMLFVTNDISINSYNFNFKELIITILLFIVVSLTEEIMCRGYILKNLVVSFGKYQALCISSSIFTLMHVFNPDLSIIGICNIFLAGILFGITYIHTKNLWFCISLHTGWNLAQSLLGFNVSGQQSYSILDISMHSNTLINGGGFGFEGSIISLVIECIAIVCIIYYFNKRTV